jgi:hypothetical protein
LGLVVGDPRARRCDIARQRGALIDDGENVDVWNKKDDVVREDGDEERVSSFLTEYHATAICIFK